MTGTLYLVSLPMGNPDELSPRAVSVLQQADVLVCEEWKTGRGLMKRLNIPETTPLLRFNEHDNEAALAELLSLLKAGKSLALFSDSGAPVLADPGAELVRACRRQHIPVTHVSGPAALVSALLLCGFRIEPFLYMGWLPRKPEERLKSLAPLKQEKNTVVVMETPYRLMALLDSVRQALGPDRPVAVCCNLTATDEHVQRGTIANVIKYFEQYPQKPEFVLVIGGIHEKL